MIAFLERSHRLANSTQSADRITVTHRQRDVHESQSIAQCSAFCFGTQIHRYHCHQIEPSSPTAETVQIAVHRSCDRGKHDIVQCPAERGVDRLDIAQRGVDPRDATTSADVNVIGRRRCLTADRSAQLHSGAARGAHGRSPLMRLACERRGSPHGLHGASNVLRHGCAKRFGRGWQWPRPPGLRRVCGVRRRLVEIEDQGRDVHARDAVGEAVVHLADQAEAVFVEALDQPQLPKRPIPMKPFGENATDKVDELSLGARNRQGGGMNVAFEAEVRVVDPLWIGYARGDEL